MTVTLSRGQFYSDVHDIEPRSAVLKAACTHPSQSNHPLLCPYLVDICLMFYGTWQYEYFLYELTGACFCTLHLEQVKKDLPFT
jgi:hypothetical protein